MKDLLSLAVLALIIFSKLLGAFLILAGLILTTTFLFLAGQENPELIEDFRWAAFWNHLTSLGGLALLGITLLPTLVGVWPIEMPTLKLWPGPDLKTRHEEIA